MAFVGSCGASGVRPSALAAGIAAKASAAARAATRTAVTAAWAQERAAGAGPIAEAVSSPPEPDLHRCRRRARRTPGRSRGAVGGGVNIVVRIVFAADVTRSGPTSVSFPPKYSRDPLWPLNVDSGRLLSGKSGQRRDRTGWTRVRQVSTAMTKADADCVRLLPDGRLGSFHRLRDLDHSRPLFRMGFELPQILFSPRIADRGLLFFGMASTPPSDGSMLYRCNPC